MGDTASLAPAQPRAHDSSYSAIAMLAIALGVAMPLVSWLIFPTYMHQMPHPGWEWARLLELPFVLFELIVILWAGRRGIDRLALWQQLPKDVKIAAQVFVIALFASSLFLSQKVAATMTMSLTMFIHGLFALAVYFLFTQARARHAGQFLYWHGLGLAALALGTAWWFSFPPPAHEVMGGVIEWHAALPGFISVRHFGGWTGAIAAGFAVSILFREQKTEFDSHHLFYFLAATMTIWSGTRASILAIVIVCALFVLFQRRLPTFKAIGRASILTGLALLAAWHLRWDDPDFTLFATGDFSSVKHVTSLRTELWAIAFERWLASPLLGWGTGSFFWEGAPHTHTQPHNFVMQFLVSWGLLGTISAVWLLGRGIQTVHRAAKGDPVAYGLLGMMYALLFQSLLEGMLHYPRFIIAIIALGALVLARAHSAQTDAPSEA